MLGALLGALAAGSTKAEVEKINLPLVSCVQGALWQLARLTCPWKPGSCALGALLGALAAGSTKAEVGKTSPQRCLQTYAQGTFLGALAA